MPREILTLGDLEPERPLVTVNRNAPADRWQRFKHRHLDVLLRWFPVRYEWSSAQYPMRLPSEFSLAQSARLQRISADVRDLQPRLAEPDATPATLTRMVDLLAEFCRLVLVAPASVIDALDLEQKMRLVLAFQVSVMGRTPTRTPRENPSTSPSSSPASAGSTAPTTG